MGGGLRTYFYYFLFMVMSGFHTLHPLTAGENHNVLFNFNPFNTLIIYYFDLCLLAEISMRLFQSNIMVKF